MLDSTHPWGAAVGRCALACAVSLCLCLVLHSPLYAADQVKSRIQQNGGEPEPIDLGVPPGCSEFYPSAINNAAFPEALVAGGMAFCDQERRAYSWRNGLWQRFELPPSAQNPGFGAALAGVSDDHPTTPTMTLLVGDEFSGSAWTVSGGNTPLELPLSDAGEDASFAVISSRGRHVVGEVHASWDYGYGSAVRWTRTADGWSAREVVGSGLPSAITADGRMVVGSYYSGDRDAWVWSAGHGLAVLLGPGASANDVSDDGRIIVGARDVPCTVRNCDYGMRPVYWTPTSVHSQWQQHDLAVPDWFGVDNIAAAVAVADVDGSMVIVGYLWAIWEGEVTYSVAWFPAADGSYGEPVLLGSLGGEDYSSAGVYDINRNGVAAGWSIDPSSLTVHGVLWQLLDPQRTAVNAGHAGAWFDPATPGQGLLLDVDPANASAFAGWFTYTPPGSASSGEPHWFTAQGTYQGSGAELTVFETLGGEFNLPTATTSTAVGTLSLSFGGCSQGQASYALDNWGLHGGFPIERLVPGGTTVCLEQADSATQAVPINTGMAGAWLAPSAPGQGVLLDVVANQEGGGFLFLAWMTYGDGTASGQRWYTAQGPFTGETATVNVYQSTGGAPDTPSPVATQQVGELTIDFSDCAHAHVDFTLADADGAIQLNRLFDSGALLCEEFAGVE